ncbi:hypothetical protein [Paenibacillus sp. GYB003]|uniref:hypothetical protein n=1 Tax=Paenibacillus sp. GYB003 TaxID=2994392 RepID=UPI002F96B813
MAQSLYVWIIIFFSMFAGVATVAIGMSKENKEGNPGYERRTKGNWTRLTLVYVVSGIAGLAIVVAFFQIR